MTNLNVCCQYSLNHRLGMSPVLCGLSWLKADTNDESTIPAGRTNIQPEISFFYILYIVTWPIKIQSKMLIELQA